MRRLAVVACALITAGVAWRWWPGLTLPSCDRTSSVAPAQPPSDDDVDDDPPVDDAPVVAARHTIAPAAYDPWAGPPPFDPRAPHLPDARESADSDAYEAAFRAAIVEATPRLHACYLRTKPTGELRVRIMTHVHLDANAGPILDRPQIWAARHQPVQPELETCLAGVVSSLVLPPLDDDASHLLVQSVVLAPDPAN